MNEGFYIMLGLGVITLAVLIYELVAQRAWGTWKKGRVRKLNSSWHSRSDDPRMYWKIISRRVLLLVIFFGIAIRELLK